MNKYEQFFKRFNELTNDIQSFVQNQDKNKINISDNAFLFLKAGDDNIDIAEVDEGGRKTTFRVVFDFDNQKAMPHTYQPSKDEPVQNIFLNEDDEVVDAETEHEISKILRKWFAGLRKRGVFNQSQKSDSNSMKNDESLDREGLKYGEHIGFSKYDIRNNIITIEDVEKEIDELSNKNMLENIKKNKILPKFNLKYEIEDEGVPADFAYLIKKMRDKLPNEPKNKSELKFYKAYVFALKEFQNIYEEIKHDSEVNRNRSETIMDCCLAIQENFFEELQHRFRKKYGTLENYYSFGRNFWRNRHFNNIKKFLMEGERKYNNGDLFKTKSDISKVSVGTIYGNFLNDDRKFFVMYEPSKNIRINLFDREFDSYNDTLSFINENKEDVKNKIKEYRRRYDRPTITKIKRKGDDYREGRDISPNEFMETFGLRAVEYGKWNSQPKVKQEYTNYAYDAFADLANTLNIPFKAIGLKNSLAIAFGARGSGKAAAHYEPSLKVINMTKMNGAGSLAHEWGHALDYFVGCSTPASEFEYKEIRNIQQNNFFGIAQSQIYNLMSKKIMAEEYQVDIDEKIKKNESQKKQVEGFFNSLGWSLSYRRKKSFSTDDIKKMIDNRKNLVNEAIEQGNLEEIRKIRTMLWKDIDSCTRLRNEPVELRSIFYWAIQAAKSQNSIQTGEVEYKSKNTKYFQNASKLDGHRLRNPYYSKKLEMFARAFESYVEDKLESKNCYSPYLVQGTKNENYLSKFNKTHIYPDGLERENINEGIENFCEILPKHLHCLVDDIDNKKENIDNNEDDHEEVFGPR